MSAFAVICLGILGLCLGIVILAVVLPVRLEIRVDKTDAWGFAAKLRPLGRLGPPISLRRRRKRKDAQPEKQSKRKHSPVSRDPAGFAKSVLRLAFEVLGKVRIEQARIRAQFGLGDPAETGMLYGRLVPVLIATDRLRAPDVMLIPDFDQAILRGHAAVTLSLVPAAMIGPGWRFLKLLWRAEI